MVSKLFRATMITIKVPFIVTSTFFKVVYKNHGFLMALKQTIIVFGQTAMESKSRFTRVYQGLL